MPTYKPRVLSGIQANGALHLGNYIGALSVWADNQDRYDNFFCIADLHALTVPDGHEPAAFTDMVETVAGLFLASGLDPERSVIFRQSAVREHAELNWALSCVTPMGWLERMTQYKSKVAAGASMMHGLFSYPVLMAADILLYQADLVPVGADQRQHVEVTRDIAGSFNRRYGEVLRLPDALIRKDGARIMGFDDPTTKMSKSIAKHKAGHAVNLLDDPVVIRRTISRAVTDSAPAVDAAALSPGTQNLLTVLACMTDTPLPDITKRYDGSRYGDLKRDVADAVLSRLEPLQATYRDVRASGEVARVLADGAERATAVARTTRDAVYTRLGLA